MQTIGTALLELGMAAATPTALAIQAVDGVVDIYSDEGRAYDGPVFRQRDFLSQLSALVPSLRARVRRYSSSGALTTQTKKIDKRKQPELRASADAVVANLVAFIRYRRALPA